MLVEDLRPIVGTIVFQEVCVPLAMSNIFAFFNPLYRGRIITLYTTALARIVRLSSPVNVNKSRDLSDTITSCYRFVGGLEAKVSSQA